MKITKEQLKQIIKEEMNILSIKESDDDWLRDRAAQIDMAKDINAGGPPPGERLISIAKELSAIIPAIPANSRSKIAPSLQNIIKYLNDVGQKLNK